MVEEALLLAIGKTSTHPEKVSVRTKRYLCPFSRDISVKPTCSWQKPCRLVSGEGDGLRLVHKQKSQVWESYRRKTFSSCLGQTGYCLRNVRVRLAGGIGSV